MINAIEPDPYSDGGCYIACTGYKQGDNHPYLFKTKDYGKTWTKITDGIAEDHFTRVVRADPAQPGILYAGTEQGMYLSFNDGRSWQKFQQNLPHRAPNRSQHQRQSPHCGHSGPGVLIIDDLSVLHRLRLLSQVTG